MSRLEASSGVILELCENAIREAGLGGDPKELRIARDMYEDIANPYTIRKILEGYRNREAELLKKLNGVMGEMAQIISELCAADASRSNDRWQKAVEIGGDDFQR